MSDKTRRLGLAKSSRRAIIVLVAIALVLGASTYYFLGIGRQTGSTCTSPLGGSRMLRTQLSPISFDGITKYLLPSPLRNPNTLYASPDGSVWFGEQTTPGLGHLFPSNGTLVEYAWPFNYAVPSNTSPTCVPKTEIWGITLWQGRVWATDSTGNQLVGLDPSTGQVQTVKVSGNFSWPYTITVSPDGNLWFTELYGSQIGMIDKAGALHEYTLPKGPAAAPSEIVFANSTVAYYVDVGTGEGSGGVYSFNPQAFSPRQIATGKSLTLPTSIATGGGGIWLALHGASDLAFYNLTKGAWTDYPTSTVTYVETTLPYFVKSNGSDIWFNEHYADKLARIDLRDNSLTEFSLSNPPTNNASDIPNALTFALGNSRAWFAQWTANYVGYLSTSYSPPFSLSSTGNHTIRVAAGSSQGVNLVLRGQSSTSLAVKFSDSESATAVPTSIHFAANATQLASLQGSVVLRVTVTVDRSVAPGEYVGLVTLSDGLQSYSVYLDIEVTSP